MKDIRTDQREHPGVTKVVRMFDREKPPEGPSMSNGKPWTRYGVWYRNHGWFLLIETNDFDEATATYEKTLAEMEKPG